MTGRKDDMTTEPTTPAPLKPTVFKPLVRKPSAKTLARVLAVYLKANSIKGDITVAELMDRLKDSIIDEVGVNLDVWEK